MGAFPTGPEGPPQHRLGQQEQVGRQGHEHGDDGEKAEGYGGGEV